MLLDKILRDIRSSRRHYKILKMVLEEGPIGIFRISGKTDLPPHKVRYSLRILERKGFLQPTSRGAEITSEGKKEIKKIDKEIKIILNEVKKFNE